MVSRMRSKTLRRQTDQPVPRHARGGTGRGRQYARRLSPRPHRFFRVSWPQPAKALPAPETETLRDYLADLDTRGFKSSSVARRLSAMRHLFRFLLNERIRSDDPAAILSGPKRGRGLPKVLSIADVDRMLTRAKELTRGPGRLSPRSGCARCGSIACWKCSTPRACAFPNWWRCRCRPRAATPA